MLGQLNWSFGHTGTFFGLFSPNQNFCPCNCNCLFWCLYASCLYMAMWGSLRNYFQKPQIDLKAMHRVEEAVQCTWWSTTLKSGNIGCFDQLFSDLARGLVLVSIPDCFSLEKQVGFMPTATPTWHTHIHMPHQAYILNLTFIGMQQYACIYGTFLNLKSGSRWMCLASWGLTTRWSSLTKIVDDRIWFDDCSCYGSSCNWNSNICVSINSRSGSYCSSRSNNGSTIAIVLLVVAVFSSCCIGSSRSIRL